MPPAVRRCGKQVRQAEKSEIEPNLERIRDVLGLDDDFPLLLYSCTAKVGCRELLGFIENNI